MKKERDMIDCFMEFAYWFIGVLIGLSMLAGVLAWVWEP
jgi:hypothetical protein